MDKPLWGLRVQKFDGAIAPRVLKFDAPLARGLWWGAYELIEGASLYKTFTTALRARKCIPPFGGWRHMNKPLWGLRVDGPLSRRFLRG